jgi:hypothetical protein
MEIGQYIVNLLRGQEKVSVAGLGTFTKIRVAGSFDQNSNVFYPPSYKIGFNERESEDSSLIQYIISKENLNKSSAEEQVRIFISSILNGLEYEQEVKIKNLGTFYKNENVLGFEAFENSGTGENDWKLNPIHESKTGEKVPHQKNEEPLIIPKVDAVEVSSLPVQEDDFTKDVKEEFKEELEEEFEEPEKTRSWLIIFLYFIIFLLSLVTVYFLHPGFKTFIKNKSTGLFSQTDSLYGENPVVLDSTKISADSLDNVIDSASIIADSLNQQPTITKDNDTLSTIISTEPPVFEIIAAAFARKSEADTYIQECSKKGIKAKIVENMPGKMLKISLGTFYDEEEAKTDLRRIHKEITKDAWIARVTPNKKSN